MFADLALPPACHFQIEYDPDAAFPNVTITVYRDGIWLGEIRTSAQRLDRPGELQRCLDVVTNRGVREVLDLPKEGEKISAALFAQMWRIVMCSGGPLDGQVVSLKSDEIDWQGYAMIRTPRGDAYRDPPPGGLNIPEPNGTNPTWQWED